MSAPQFIFGGDTGVTPEQLKRNRRIMEALQERASSTPRNVGEGLNAVGQAILFRVQKSRVEKGEAAANEVQKGLWGAFGPASAGSGMTPTAAALNAPASSPSPFSDPTPTSATASAPAASIPTGERAGYIRSGLISRGLPEHVADGFMANFQDESGLDPGINEHKPLVPGSRGGFGLYQLTGPRRREYEAFAGQRGVDPSDIDAQLDFMMGELGGSEKRAGERILASRDTASAAQAIVNDFLRPAPSHRQERINRYAGLGGSAPVEVASLDPSAGVAQATGGMIATPQNGAIGDPESVRPYSGPGAQVDMPPQLGGTQPDPDEQRRRDGATAAKDIAVARALGVQLPSGPAGMSPVAAALNGPQAGAQPQPQQSPQRPPAQVAQAQPMQMQTQMPAMPAYQGPDPQAMMGVLQNPWASDDQKQLAQYHLQQYGKHQQAAQTYALEAAQQQREWQREDQRYAVEDRREDTRLGLDQQRFQHERSQPINVGGVLIDPQTYQPVYQAPADPFTLNPGEIRFDGAGNRIAAGGEKPGFRQATPAEAESFGAAAGQFGPDGRFYAENPPSGMSVEVGPDGTRIVQGPGAGSGGGKVPANFERDPNNPAGVRPIAGGPGEQLPAEFAGRIGISDSFLGQAPQLREQLLEGNVTGPWDRLQAGMNSSSGQAEIYRKLQSGADALQRLLTGAGMTENEAKVYAERYLPSYTDDAASAVTKLDQMVREIQNVRAASLRGRGGMGATVTPNGPALGSPSNPIQLDEAVVPSGQNGGLPSDVTEEDIQHTMQVHGLTREQVLERLR